MSRHAVRTGFEGFVDDVVDLAYEEFDVVGAVRNGASGGSGRVVSKLVKESDALDRHVVRPLLAEYKESIMTQFDYVLEYAATADAEFDEFAADVLTSDLYFESLRPDISRDRQAEVEQRLLRRQRQLGDAIQPLVRADADQFWPAVRAAFDEKEAESFVETHFSFTGPLAEHRSAFEFTTGIDPADVIGGPLARGLPSIRIDYTEEAVRTMRTAEAAVVEDTLAEIGRRFG